MYLGRARSSWQQLPLATLLPFARLLYFNVETLPLARITIRNTVTIRQVLRDWHHRPIFLALKSLQFASFFFFLPIPYLANVLDIGVRKFLSQWNRTIKLFRAFWILFANLELFKIRLKRKKKTIFKSTFRKSARCFSVWGLEFVFRVQEFSANLTKQRTNLSEIFNEKYGKASR